MSELEADKLADVDRMATPRQAPGASPAWRRALSNAWYELRKSRTASIGAGHAGAAVRRLHRHAVDRHARSDQAELPRAPRAAVSEQHLLGTDRLGRDIYSRLL